MRLRHAPLYRGRPRTRDATKAGGRDPRGWQSRNSPQARISALGPESGSAAGSSQPEAPGANRLRASCNRLRDDSAAASALPNLRRSGHHRRDPVRRQGAALPPALSARASTGASRESCLSVATSTSPVQSSDPQRAGSRDGKIASCDPVRLQAPALEAGAALMAEFGPTELKVINALQIGRFFGLCRALLHRQEPVISGRCCGV